MPHESENWFNNLGVNREAQSKRSGVNRVPETTKELKKTDQIYFSHDHKTQIS